ncbi:MAG: aminopeptidase PepB [Kangiella sp.]|nr:MAG: aminopeptidase PepB [Kangiella sp.]
MNSDSNVLVVELTNEKPLSHWASDNTLSFENNVAKFHVPESTNQDQLSHLLNTQRLARKLVGMNPKAFKLVGDWNFESQWHFWQGAYSPKNDSPKKDIPIQFASLTSDEKQKLEALIKVYRWSKALINETPENLSPQELARKTASFITELAPDSVTFTTIEGEDLKKAGLVGIYNVGRGSERPPVLLELDYCPNGSDESTSVALVGKGITFDTGGYSMKSSVGMLHMKCDMGGAATVAGALGLAIIQGLKTRVKLYLCCAENMVSGHAYLLSDILTYKNGVSVEVVNTDAEGRLVLADGLIKASESDAHTIIDAATLTGAACVALGDHYNALFTMDDELADKISATSIENHDPLWRLPLEKFHQDNCPSNYAVTANSKPQPGGGVGGASNAAGFLSRFVDTENKKWAHFDLAACFRDSGDSLFSAGATGRGIRSIASFLCDQ